MGVGQSEHVIRRCEYCSPARNGCAERRKRLVGVILRVKKTSEQLVPIGKILVDIDAELIFLVVARERVRGFADPARQNRLRRRNREASIQQFGVQKGERNRVDVGSILGHGYSAKRSRLSSK